MNRLFSYSYLTIVSFLYLSVAPKCFSDNNLKDEILSWLKKAEIHAYRIKDPNERDLALSLLAGNYVKVRHYEKAHSIISGFDEANQKTKWGFCFMLQAIAGDIKGALQKIQTFKDEDVKYHCLYYVIRECNEKYISHVLKLIEKQPKKDRCSLYERVVRKQVLLGKLDDAKNTFQDILDPNNKSEANNWILAGQIAEENNIANAISHATQFVGDPNYYLKDITRSKIKAGKIKEAEKIIDNISEQDFKVDGYIAIARYYSRKDQNFLFKLYLHKAKIYNEHANRTLYQEMNYWSLAIMQAEAGMWDAALEDAKRAENLNNIFAEYMREKYGRWTPSLHYNDGKQLYRLMIYAGRLDDVLQIILNNNELLSDDITSSLTYYYAKNGNIEKIRKLIDIAKTEKEKYDIYISIVYGLIAQKTDM